VAPGFQERAVAERAGEEAGSPGDVEEGVVADADDLGAAAEVNVGGDDVARGAAEIAEGDDLAGHPQGPGADDGVEGGVAENQAPEGHVVRTDVEGALGDADDGRGGQ